MDESCPWRIESLDELNKLAARAGTNIGINAEFTLADDRRLVVIGGVNHAFLGGKGITKLAATVQDDRGSPLADPVLIRVRTPSAAFRELARSFPDATFPPSSLTIYPTVAGVRNDTVKRLVRAGLAEAFGQAPPPPKSSRKPVSSDPDEWVGVLKNGTAGVSRWNRLRAADRKAVDLSGADLSGADLSGAKLRGVRAKGASFIRSTLRSAELGGACIEKADLSSADLQDADLKGVQANGAIFREAKLPKANLKDGVCAGASFADADLSGTNLSVADLRKADFSGARLDGLTLDGATFDGQTTWPDGFTIPAEALFAGRGTDPRLSGKGKNAVATDINGLMARLQSLIDPKRMKRTLDMLKAGKNQLFAEVEPDFIRGIVRSQTADELIYSCVLTEDGSYACCTPDLSLCMGLAGEPCKHLLVLLIGLARAGQLDPATIDRWIVAASAKNHRWNKKTKNHVSDTLLKYKGVQAGEVDWRPTETIPEDFYTL